jgi:hypothetical protein
MLLIKIKLIIHLFKVVILNKHKIDICSDELINFVESILCQQMSEYGYSHDLDGDVGKRLKILKKNCNVYIFIFTEI